MTAPERRESRDSRSGSNLKGVNLALAIVEAAGIDGATRIGRGSAQAVGGGATSASTLNKRRAERGRASYSLTKGPGLAYMAPSVAAFSRLLFFPGGGVVFRRTL